MQKLNDMFKEIDAMFKEIKGTKIFKQKPIRKISTKHTKKFHKKKHKIPRIIYNTIDKHEIIYGEHALKKRFPKYLERPTTDYDIYTHTPKKDALQAERALDRSFGGNFFFVKPAVYPDTYKVVAYANQKGYADFSKPENKIPYDTIQGKKYVKLSVEKQHRKKSLNDPSSSWRHGTDQDAMNRMKIYEKQQRR